MRRKVAVIGLELYALALAVLHFVGGVLTDEAKYLLNIPYPHPPLVRSILGLTAGVPGDAFLWRFLFASLLVQCVWLIHDLCGGLGYYARYTVMIVWLFCATMILQAGTVMMAPLTAVAGLFFVYSAMRYGGYIGDKRSLVLTKSGAFLVACLWLASLFTAYQAILFFPLVFATLWRASISKKKCLVYFFGPILVLSIYTLSNPLVLASMGIVAGKDGGLPLLTRLSGYAKAWLVAGDLLFGILGAIGIIRGRRWELIATFIIVSAYMIVSDQDYYAILLLPLLIGGLVDVFSRMAPRWQYMVWALSIPVIILFALPSALSVFSDANPARDSASSLRSSVPTIFDDPSKKMLIVGSFGHDWEYYFPFAIHKYSDALADKKADVIACVQACPATLKEGMYLATAMPVEIYVRK